MKLYISVKTMLKGLKSSFMISLLYFLALPLLLAWFLGMVTGDMFQNPIKTEPISIVVYDKDSSKLSSNLTNFLKGDLSSVLKINKDDSDADLKLTIPKGYENNILNEKSNTLNIEKLGTNDDLAILLQNILDTYHEKLYLNNSQKLSSEDFSKLFNKSSIATSIIKSDIEQNSYEYFALVSLGFLVIIFIMNNILSNYISESKGLSKRLYSMPITRVQYLIYDFVGLWIYSFIFLLLYVLFFRILGITFKGNLAILTLLCALSSYFMTSISTFVTSFFSKKYGTFIVYMLLFLQTIFGGIFNMISETFTKFTSLSPTYLIGALYSDYESFNTLSSISNLIVTCLVASTILIIFSIVKEKYKWREI
ncbi:MULTISPECIES: ABC transporter permease [unclassified Clostridioides]|uniref:ABC transporter permease n=1 Tax=unclassified Clostridioides TaxID=2635829 RepID=UPI001D1245D3|nr:ABC transporter permease [Clostridioides sp. ES-S-0190-01]UDN57357.1 ABC transporter permease [Clostridioides sp. ES-S-0010-02]